MQPLLLPASLVVGLLVGALLAWLLARGRVTSQVEAAVATSQGAALAELAQLRERVRQSDESRHADQIVHGALKLEADGWRNALDTARDECAQLAERASRVPVLQA